MATELRVWLGDDAIAVLDQPNWPRVRCRYTDSALDRWPANSPVVSCSLPLADGGQDATAFCVGLLPEGRTLDVMAREANIPSNEILDLLGRYGRDVAGALTISADPPEIRRFGIEPYTASTLAAAVGDLDAHPLGADDESELSLAGLQDKLLLVRDGDGWARPLRGRPSSHILKLDDRRFPGLVAAEADCLRLARAAGLTSVDIELTELGGADCLIISRFDRALEDGELARVHQEDLCQATGIDPREQRGRAKYERGGGPSLRLLARLLDAYSTDPLTELDRLVAIITFTIAIGNADAHGKNLALLHPEPTAVTLAPLYDTVPTLLWDSLRTEAAMSIGAGTSMLELNREDIVREAQAWHHSPERAAAMVIETANALIDAVSDGVISDDSPVADLVTERAEQLRA